MVEIQNCFHCRFIVVICGTVSDIICSRYSIFKNWCLFVGGCNSKAYDSLEAKSMAS